MKKSLLSLLCASLLVLAGCAASPEVQRDASSAPSTCERSTGSNLCRR